MRVVVTRPAQEAQRWVQALAGQGLEAQALPLIAIHALADESALHAAWRALPGCHAVMFVSANAVAHFFAARPAAAAWGMARAWATGPGTAAALLRAGVPATAIDAPAPDAAQFDSEALWALVQAQAVRGRTVLIVRGADADGRGSGRPWLAERLGAADATVEQVIAYQRALPLWPDEMRARACRAAHDGSVWVFSSSDAARHLAALLPGQGWHGATAVATHGRIAQAVRGLGFGRVQVSAPALAAVAASIESLR